MLPSQMHYSQESKCMSLNYSLIKDYTSEPEQELTSIKTSFEEHVALAGKETYRPRIMFYNFFGEKLFGIVSRPYVDQTDYVSSLAEMMYSYSALDAYSAVIVLDSNLTKGGQVVGNCLNAYFLSNQSAHAITIPYEHSQDNKVIWKTSDESIKEVDMNKNTGMPQEMLELAYAFSHVDTAPFPMPELLSYYTSMGFVFKAFKVLGYNYIDYTENNT